MAKEEDNMVSEASGMTLGEAIARLLPKGTYPWLGEDESQIWLSVAEQENWEEPPFWPTDVFAVAAHLVQSSGLLTYFEPDPDYRRRSTNDPFGFTLGLKDRLRCVEVGKKWAVSPTTPRLVRSHWQRLMSSWTERVRASHHAVKGRDVPDWWRSAIALIIIADEACVGLGAPPDDQHQDRWLVDYFQEVYETPFRADNHLGHNTYRADRQPSTFGRVADPDVGCVQPKSRVSGVGCTMRNLSRHVAFLAHAGSVRCHWQQPAYANIDHDTAKLDVLIVPLPYRLEDECVVASSKISPHPDKRPNWGNFSIDQRWLADETLVNAVVEEIKKAKASLGADNLNGIVFPEYALTEHVFNKICTAAREVEPRLEFAIAGSSSNCEDEHGNFVLTALWYGEREANQQNNYLLTSRRKHHRWRLNGSQITSYGLEGILDPAASWWEEHKIAQREIHFFHFRQSSVFTTMICEDLARSDPVHDILRGVGPNLLFALLMDGPQLRARWPYIYASSLADDPGTSVLSVTSMGLIERQANQRNPTVALWKDEAGTVKEIKLDDGSKSVLLTLEAQTTRDQTLDGRVVSDARSWRYLDDISL